MDSWTDWDEGLAFNEALFHFPVAWAKALENWNARLLRSSTGFLEFCTELVAYAHFRLQEKNPTLKTAETTAKMLRLEPLFSAALGESSLDFANPPEKFLAEIRNAMEAVEWRARLELSGEGARLRHHAFMRGWDEIYAVLAILLLEPDNRGLVARCGYPACSRYYIPSRDDAGRPEGYCTDAHRELDVTPRKRRQRAMAFLKRFSKPEREQAVLTAQREHPNERKAERLAAFAESYLRATRRRK